MSWSPQLYTQFEDQRTRPVRDLLAAVPLQQADSAVDLGCGPGNSTEILASRYPGAALTGVDSSPEMIEAAKRRLPNVDFVLADLARWQAPAPFNLVLSNAALQWVADHARLMPRLASMLSPGGCLAVQMPDNLDDPAQTAMQRVAAEGPWVGKLSGAPDARTPIGDAGYYYRLLKPLCAEVDIWRTTYIHPLAGRASVVEWFRSTGLRPFLDKLSPDERVAFLARYQEAIAPAYPEQMDGTVLLQMARLFIVARK